MHSVTSSWNPREKWPTSSPSQNTSGVDHEVVVVGLHGCPNLDTTERRTHADQHDASSSGMQHTGTAHSHGTQSQHRHSTGTVPTSQHEASSSVMQHTGTAHSHGTQSQHSHSTVTVPTSQHEASSSADQAARHRGDGVGGSGRRHAGPNDVAVIDHRSQITRVNGYYGRYCTWTTSMVGTMSSCTDLKATAEAT